MNNEHAIEHLTEIFKEKSNVLDGWEDYAALAYDILAKEMPNEWIEQMSQNPIEFFLYNINRHLPPDQRIELVTHLLHQAKYAESIIQQWLPDHEYSINGDEFKCYNQNKIKRMMLEFIGLRNGDLRDAVCDANPLNT